MFHEFGGGERLEFYAWPIALSPPEGIARAVRGESQTLGAEVWILDGRCDSEPGAQNRFGRSELDPPPPPGGVFDPSLILLVQL
jgi:hypothetical protein